MLKVVQLILVLLAFSSTAFGDDLVKEAEKVIEKLPHPPGLKEAEKILEDLPHPPIPPGLPVPVAVPTARSQQSGGESHHYDERRDEGRNDHLDERQDEGRNHHRDERRDEGGNDYRDERRDDRG